MHRTEGFSCFQGLLNRELQTSSPFSLQRELLQRNLTEGRCHDFILNFFDNLNGIQEISAFCMNSEILCAHDKQNIFFYHFMTGEKRAIRVYPSENTTDTVNGLFEIVGKTLLFGFTLNGEKGFQTIDLSAPTLQTGSVPDRLIAEEHSAGGNHVIAAENEPSQLSIWNLDGTDLLHIQLPEGTALLDKNLFTSLSPETLLHTEEHTLVLRNEGFYVFNRETGSTFCRKWGKRTHQIHGCWAKNGTLVASISYFMYESVIAEGFSFRTLSKKKMDTLRVYNLENKFSRDHLVTSPGENGAFFLDRFFFWQQQLEPTPLQMTDLSTGETVPLIENEEQGIHLFRNFNEKEGLLVVEFIPEEENPDEDHTIFKLLDIKTRKFIGEPITGNPTLLQEGTFDNPAVKCEEGRIVFNWAPYLQVLDYNIASMQDDVF